MMADLWQSERVMNKTRLDSWFFAVRCRAVRHCNALFKGKAEAAGF